MKKHLLPFLCVLVLALSVSLAGAEVVDDSAQPVLSLRWSPTDGDLPFPTVVEEEDQVVFQNLSWLSDLGVQPEAMGVVYAYSYMMGWYKAGDVQDHGDWIVVKMSPKELIASQWSFAGDFLEFMLPGNERFESIVFYFDATANTVEKALSFILKDGKNSVSWNAEGAQLYQSKNGWEIRANYDPDGWLSFAMIYPTEDPGYPQFRYRRNENALTGYDFWWGYDENHWFSRYDTSEDGIWYNPNTGEKISGPEGVSGTPELPFRLIGLEEVPFGLITPEGGILSFQEGREISYSLPPKATAPLDYSWLFPPDISESVFLTQPVRFPEFLVCESTQDQNDFILTISGLGPEGWKVQPEALKVWQYDLETESWSDLEDSTDNLLVLRVPKGILNLEDDPYVDDDGPVCSWRTFASNEEEQGYLEIALTLSPAGGVVSNVVTSLPEEGILYTVYDGGMNSSIQYSDDFQMIDASYVLGSLIGYEVCKYTDDSFLDYSYAVYSQGEYCYLRNIYYRDRKSDRAPIDIVWDGGKWILLSETEVTDQEFEELIELCPALPIQ